MNAVGAASATASPYVKLIPKNVSMLVMASMTFIAAGHVACLK
jgi:hypothetical protein